MNAVAKAWIDWRDSEEGTRCRDGIAGGEYLENRLWRAFMAGNKITELPGPTDQFPDGELDETDGGQLKMLISSDTDIVRLDFGKPIAWFAMPKAQALTFAFTVLERCGVQIQHQIQQNPTPGEPS